MVDNSQDTNLQQAKVIPKKTVHPAWRQVGEPGRREAPPLLTGSHLLAANFLAIAGLWYTCGCTVLSWQPLPQHSDSVHINGQGDGQVRM